VPGVTTIDAAALVRSKATPQPRNRLLSWISGEYPADVPTKSESQAVAPPDDDVRREILRLELEAQVANLQAEADAIRAEAAAEGRTIDIPDVALPGGEAEASAEPDADGASDGHDLGTANAEVLDVTEEPPPA
jgi:hypothetical protein